MQLLTAKLKINQVKRPNYTTTFATDIVLNLDPDRLITKKKKEITFKKK